MDEILSGLNAEQRAAVEHGDGPLLVVAGAGTGKTQVITRRIAYLIAGGKAKPNEILALTFTEKAAREMEERLYELIGWSSFSVPVMTFHAFGAELLGRFASHIGRSTRGGLLNDTQKAVLLQQQIGRMQWQYYGPQADTFEFLEGIVEYIGNLQNAGVTPERYTQCVADLKRDPGEMNERDVAEQVDLAELYQLYELVKQETGTFDYHDQLHLPLQILQQRPNVAKRLAQEYRYVLVDEYQDTNAVQDELLRAFVNSTGNLFAVGDDDQAIYGFRGADINNILNFTQHFQINKPVVLTHNYRSGQEILDRAYELIGHNNPDRLEFRLGIDKHLVSNRGEGDTQYREYASALDETNGVAEDLAARIEAGEAPGSIGVLAATHAPLANLAKSLRNREIPFALSTAVNIFEQPELIALWYLLRWLAWQADEAAIGHVIMGPFFGWGADQYRRVLDESREQLLSLEEILRVGTSEHEQELMAKLDKWRGWAQVEPVSRLAFRLVFETGAAKRWEQQAEHSPRMVRVFEDLQRWLAQMQDFESIEPSSVLGDYTQRFPKPPKLEVAEPVGDAGGVQLLTVHAAKGLEFDTVYLIGCTQRSWSGNRGGLRRTVPEVLAREAPLPPEHEFRRLMYVAVTRARRLLVVSAAGQTNSGSKQAVSPLVNELFGDDKPQAALSAANSRSIGEVMKKLQRFYPLQSYNVRAQLPFETSDGWLDLSVTALGRYNFCPFEFYLENVLQIKQPIGPQVAFGNVLHKVFERYYKARLSGNREDESALHAWLDELWSDRGYERRELANADKTLAHVTLDSFLVREDGLDRTLVASEMPIRFDVADGKLHLRGKIDAVFMTEDGAELRDFKTGRNMNSEEKAVKAAKDSFQLRSYALAYESHNDVAPAQVVLDYVVTGVEGAAKLTPVILRNHRAKQAELAERIRARDFAPNASALHECAAIRYYGTGEAEELLDAAMEDAGLS